MTTSSERQQKLVEDLAEHFGLSHEQILAEADRVVLVIRSRAEDKLRRAVEARRAAVAAEIEAVRIARDIGLSWKVIGDALGVARQSAYEKYGLRRRESGSVTLSGGTLPAEFKSQEAPMKLTQEQAEKVVAYAKEIAGEDVTITDVVEAVKEYDEAAQQWIVAVAKVMDDYDVSEAEANAALAAVLDDHEIRGALWSAAVEEIMERDNVNEVQANENLLNLLRSLELEQEQA